MYQKFDAAFKKLISPEIEGTHYNPNDPSKFGVSQSTFDEFKVNNPFAYTIQRQDVYYLTQQEAMLFYFLWAWGTLKGELFESQILINALFASYVHRPGYAVKCFQFALAVEEDGLVTTETLIVAQGWSRSEKNQYILDAFLFEMEKRYREEVERDPSRQKNLEGWLNRLEALRSL